MHVRLDRRFSTAGFLLALAVTLPAHSLTFAPIAQAGDSVGQYRVIDLGTLGGTFSSPLDINSRGEVTGVTVPLGDGALRGFVWKRGLMTDLGTLGGPQGAGASINAKAQVGGWSDIDVPAPPSIFNETSLFCNPPMTSGEAAVACRASLWQHGRLRDLGTLGGLNSTAWNKGINDRGQVVGAAETAVVDPTSTRGSPQFHAFLWSSGKMSDLGALGNDPDSIATGINERGEVVGLSVADGDTYNGQNVRGFVWAAGRMAALATLGGSHAGPAAINNRGQVVGQSQLPGDAVSHAVLWTHGRANDLGTVPGDVSSAAVDITDQGRIVGQSCASTGACRAALWVHGSAVDLNTLISGSSGWQLTGAAAVNERGQIVGDGIHDGEPHAYLLTRK